MVSILLAAALIYVGDYAALRYRIPHNRSQFGSVTVQRMWVIPMKNGKTQYSFDPPGAAGVREFALPAFRRSVRAGI